MLISRAAGDGSGRAGSSTITLATLYLQNTRGLAPLTAAVLLLPFSIAVIAGSALAAPTAAGIINTAAQLGTALGIAVLLLIAALTTGVPERHTPTPAPAWILAAAFSLAAAVTFARAGPAAPRATN